MYLRDKKMYCFVVIFLTFQVYAQDAPPPNKTEEKFVARPLYNKELGFTVTIMFREGMFKKAYPLCLGTLVTMSHVMTCESCTLGFFSSTNDRLYVVGGSNKVYYKKYDKSYQVRTISKFLFHEDHYPPLSLNISESLYKRMALMVLQHPFVTDPDPNPDKPTTVRVVHTPPRYESESSKILDKYILRNHTCYIISTGAMHGSYDKGWDTHKSQKYIYPVQIVPVEECVWYICSTRTCNLTARENHFYGRLYCVKLLAPFDKNLNPNETPVGEGDVGTPVLDGLDSRTANVIGMIIAVDREIAQRQIKHKRFYLIMNPFENLTDLEATFRGDSINYITSGTTLFYYFMVMLYLL